MLGRDGFGEGRGESIAAAGNGLDNRATGVIILKCLAEERDVAVKADLFDGRIGPNQAHQFGLLDDLTAPLHEDVERIRHLGQQRHAFFAAKEEALRWIVAEGAETVSHGEWTPQMV